MKKVYVTHDLALAHHLQSLLEEVGIPAMVRGEHTSTIQSVIGAQLDLLPSVWIIDDVHLELAIPLVRNFEASLAAETSHAEGPLWSCTSCGEEVESQFTVCWNCGEDRP
ncbi:MAG: DUF2007 domain-containing protein [Planctomycetota bacterium]